MDDANVVIRYNLALLLPHCFGPDNGRVLGFDNAHGVHERHFLGELRWFRLRKLFGDGEAPLSRSGRVKEEL